MLRYIYMCILVFCFLNIKAQEQNEIAKDTIQPIKKNSLQETLDAYKNDTIKFIKLRVNKIKRRIGYVIIYMGVDKASTYYAVVSSSGNCTSGVRLRKGNYYKINLIRSHTAMEVDCVVHSSGRKVCKKGGTVFHYSPNLCGFFIGDDLHK